MRARGDAGCEDRGVSLCLTEALEAFVMQERLVMPMTMTMPTGLPKLPRVEEASQRRHFGADQVGAQERNQQEEKRPDT
ncbi:MAG: hypothetical protein DMD89_11040 [Candidatus Rokuibacteriota bacterium]|nr:MAG: hypothetical protein DMD89_11040 [Candidatus Rokubacteria bacterium]